MMRKLLALALVAALLPFGAVGHVLAQNPSAGGAFLPLESYVVAGQWTFKGYAPVFQALSGVMVANGTSVATAVTAPTGTIVGTSDTQTLTNKTLTAPILSGSVTGTYTLAGTPTISTASAQTSGAFGDRVVKTATTTLSGTTIHSAAQAWTNPEAGSIIILRAWIDITTASSGASTLDIGYTAVSIATSSDSLLDGISGTPAAVFDSLDPALDSGTNAHAQKAASAKWVTISQASGDTTGLVGVLYIQYIVI